MSLPPLLQNRLSLPVICAPMFILSCPELVIAQCLGGLVGAFPALNARPEHALEEWLQTIEAALAQARAANPERRIGPFAVNQIIHPTNARLEHDMEVCIRHRVPLIITSLHAPGEIVKKVHAYGGLVFHDVISVRHAEKALEAGVDGLILVCAGAGGHAGTLSPFALVSEVRRFYSGPLALAGALSSGSAILAAQAMGADLAYMGTRFIATQEARASQAYKDCIVASKASDILYTPYFTGVPGNYLKASIRAAGLDPDKMPDADTGGLSLTKDSAKVWRDIWGAGQGVGSIDAVLPAAELIARLQQEYAAARQTLAGQ
ncbi:nitronate monooxygenase family protein [Uliginosibacterium sp. 31-16]|uniref:NAD(P)H-dependent flavin oxidoreductase n=1 Tax=Uliginosibacterium sp. 31-16 TaxID=3068315 RepID=UPI00274018A6|nr:nitronate monooxygenase family protein [Uliginosibacterium sp. 31-16]MDP5238507.1 nitronate monooxygenase family protein [Uliginosibacterium sp. 31-16]